MVNCGVGKLMESGERNKIMPTHSTSAYKDGHKWIVFCVKCGQEEPLGDCNEGWLARTRPTIENSMDLKVLTRRISYHMYLALPNRHFEKRK